MATFEGKLVGIKRKRPQTMSKLETGSNTLLGQAIETSDTDTLEYILSNTEDIPEAVSTIPVEYIPKFIEFLSNQFASYQDMSPVCLSWLTVIFQKHLKHLKENPHVSELLQEVRMRLKHRTSMMSSLRGLKVKVDLALSTWSETGAVINADGFQIFRETEPELVQNLESDSEGESTSHKSQGDLEY